MAEKALEGVKVIEIAEMISGPYCGKILADMGAEVIKIERPVTGDPSRRRPPLPPSPNDLEKSGLFLYLNSNKFGITLDYKAKEGKEVFKKLLVEADILIGDKQPNALQEFGLDYHQMLREYPSLIIVSVTPFGLTGPYANYKAYPLNIGHAGGQGYTLPRYPQTQDRPPTKPGGNSVSYDSGMGAALAALAALFFQKGGGGGQLVDISEQEIQLDLVRVEAVTYANGGDPIMRWRQPHLAGVGGNYMCQDGYVNAAPSMPKYWDIFMEMLDNPSWSKTEMCETPEARAANYLKINELIGEMTAQYKKWDLTEKGQAIKFPITPVLNPEEVANSEHFAERGFFAEVTHPKIGSVSKFPKAPYIMEKTPWQYIRSAPLLGEHNREILLGHLGLTNTEMECLENNGIV